LASSDATKKKRNYDVKELAALAIKPRSGLPSLCFFINTLRCVCLVARFFEFLFKGYPSFTLQTFKSILQGNIIRVNPDRFWWKLLFTIEYELRVNRHSISYFTKRQNKAENNQFIKTVEKAYSGNPEFSNPNFFEPPDNSNQKSFPFPQ